MSKKIKAYYDDKQNRIILEENCEKQDYIDVNELSAFGEFIKKESEKFKNEFEKEFVEKYKNSEEFKKLIEQNKMLDNLKEQISVLKESNIKLMSEKENIRLNVQNEKNNEINALKMEIQKLQNGIEIEKQKQKSELEIKFSEKINKLENEKNNLRSNLENEKKLAVVSYQESDEFKKLKDKETKLEIANEKIKDLIKDIDELQRKRSQMNIKQLGEDFEQECFKMYENSMGQNIEDCMFEKATISKNGNKPDFVFSVFAKNVGEFSEKEIEKFLLGKVILEMKTEQMNSVNKKSNAEHLEKLEKDRINYEADYAVLVTELEKEDVFYIKRSCQFKNIFIVRPDAMIGILSLLREMYIKNKDIKLKEIEFEDKQKIIDTWEEFKESLLKNSFEKINKNLEKIIDSAEKISGEAEKIRENAKTLLNSHLDALKNKVEKFDINKKIVNKIN